MTEYFYKYGNDIPPILREPVSKRDDWGSASLKKGNYMFTLMPGDGYMMIRHVDRTIDPYLASATNHATGQTYSGLHATLADARKACEGIST